MAGLEPIAGSVHDLCDKLLGHVVLECEIQNQGGVTAEPAQHDNHEHSRPGGHSTHVHGTLNVTHFELQINASDTLDLPFDEAYSMTDRFLQVGTHPPKA
jgi:hypothetical protein